MRKQIYFKISVNNHGLFEQKNFSDYMDRFKGASSVSSHIANCGKDYAQIYHIEPQGITVHHEQSEEGQVLVCLFGKLKGIGEVERKISEDAKEFKGK